VRGRLGIARLSAALPQEEDKKEGDEKKGIF
jgi:hypothetical protein